MSGHIPNFTGAIALPKTHEIDHKPTTQTIFLNFHLLIPTTLQSFRRSTAYIPFMWLNLRAKYIALLITTVLAIIHPIPF
jgi:hypothetical protein